MAGLRRLETEGAAEVKGQTLKGLECHTKSVDGGTGSRGMDRLACHGCISLHWSSSQPRVRFMTPTQQHDPEGRGYLMPCPWLVPIKHL